MQNIYLHQQNKQARYNMAKGLLYADISNGLLSDIYITVIPQTTNLRPCRR